MLTQKNSQNNYLSNYFDFVEETPNDIQKYLSKCREIDYKTTSRSFLLTIQTNPQKNCQQIQYSHWISFLSSQVSPLK